MQPVVVSANSDGITEGNEQFSLILSNNNVAIAGPSVVLVTIIDVGKSSKPFEIFK